jgi:hypothetical protein
MFGKNMNRDPFAPPSKKKLLVYSWIGVALLVLGGAMSIAMGESPLRTLLSVLGFGLVAAGFVAGYMWLLGGRRSETPAGPTGVRPPVRMMKALPYMFVFIALFYLMKLFEVFGSK